MIFESKYRRQAWESIQKENLNHEEKKQKKVQTFFINLHAKWNNHKHKRMEKHVHAD
ncbi:hypothetical protein [Longirhabdus pacifica]|uniref:hypothetical protein n=1 Tax=Longirhabdus pacifica TaxID=2305227 RepID=UPI0013E8BBB0|nr:hypothetical protein [Longirhabdus pacifica]